MYEFPHFEYALSYFKLLREFEVADVKAIRAGRVISKLQPSKATFKIDLWYLCADKRIR